MKREGTMPLSIDEILGIDPNSPTQRLARELLDNERELFRSLVSCRQASRLSVHDVAERMGIPVEDVRGIESGHRDLHLSTVRRYAHAVRGRIDFHVTPLQIPSLHGEDSAPWILTRVSPTEWAANAPRAFPSSKSNHGV